MGEPLTDEQLWGDPEPRGVQGEPERCMKWAECPAWDFIRGCMAEQLYGECLLDE